MHQLTVARVCNGSFATVAAPPSTAAMSEVIPEADMGPMPRDASLTLAHLIGKLDVLSVAFPARTAAPRRRPATRMAHKCPGP
jgi:hypothetical protein